MNDFTLHHLTRKIKYDWKYVYMYQWKIIDIVLIFPVNKTIGADLISKKNVESYKTFHCHIIIHLYLLFNCSQREFGFLPIMWKQANDIPLLKQDVPSVLSKYRQVSLLSCVGKGMECIVFKHFYNYL